MDVKEQYKQGLEASITVTRKKKGLEIGSEEISYCYISFKWRSQNDVIKAILICFP